MFGDESCGGSNTPKGDVLLSYPTPTATVVNATTTLAPPTVTTGDLDPAQGLVTCAITRRVRVSAGQGATRFTFPDAEECAAGAAAVAPYGWNGHEGPVPMLEVSPGLVRLTAPDLNRRERAANRRADAPLMVSESELFGTDEEEPAKRGMVTCWTPKSRARMVASLAELDLAPMMMGLNDPAMVTLTYPKAWEVVAPDGESVKKHLDQFRKRYERAWGHRLMCVWKMEFQRRGAPHFHLEMAPPSGVAGAERIGRYEVERQAYKMGLRKTSPRLKNVVGDGLPFQEWLSLVWADIVDHPDPVERMKHEGAGTRVDYAEGDRGRDPKRLAVYFGKHGMYADKEYQHEVPELWKESGKSVGRFWGYWGLSKVKGAAVLDFDSMIFLGRVLRRYGTTTKVWNEETQTHEFRPVLRTVWRPRRRVDPDGTVRPARHVGGAWVEDAEGVPVDAVHYRKQTVRARRMTGPMGAGFLLVNDGPAMARELARALEARGGGRRPVGMRGPVGERVGG